MPSIIQHLEKKNTSPVASFLFSADSGNRADPFIIARSWVSQFISQSRDAFELACDKQNIQCRKTASTTEVIQLLREILQKLPQCICVVDGLDKCKSIGSWSALQNRSLSSFIRAITHAASKTASRILLVSREDQDIRNEISDFTSRPVGIEFSEYKISPPDVQPDATLVSQSIVNRKLSNKEQPVRDKIVQRMVDRSGSMLLHIRLMETDLRGGKNQKQLEHIVDQAPVELNGLYDRSWERIMGRQRQTEAKLLQYSDR
ncbi:hypothetical protein OOU_Y34scaffold00857g7 [Pyricularia oryzae Y34]|uniref:Nephrocystin 3-like N-terminal domain-containing protein n=1 Tax=Pyricularia oryzae (strain Y34) TaxID=1143189 RepID=A0AA97NPE1_PYRO3|nr:hypothetical protein OOU_Y34scaffold00857g7 [Pyricularia oryzae Y34]